MPWTLRKHRLKQGVNDAGARGTREQPRLDHLLADVGVGGAFGGATGEKSQKFAGETRGYTVALTGEPWASAHQDNSADKIGPHRCGKKHDVRADAVRVRCGCA